MIAALPEMEPSAEERTKRIVDGRYVLGLEHGIKVSLNAAYRDGQSSALAALQPLIEAAREVAGEYRSDSEYMAALARLRNALYSFPATPGGSFLHDAIAGALTAATSAAERAERERIVAFLRDERTAWRITADSDAWKYNPDTAHRMDQAAQAVWRISRALADALSTLEPAP